MSRAVALKSGKVSLEETIAGLRASIASAEGERDRFKGLYEGLGMNPGDFSGALTNTHLRSSNSGNV